MTASALPTEDRPIQMDPELAAEVEKLLKPLKGKDREAADEAVRRVHQSSLTGNFAEILDAYETAVLVAIG